MNTNPRYARTALSLALSATLAVGPMAARDVHAATVQWTGLGSSASWSEALNWSPLGVPAEGDDLLFGSAPPRTTSLFDLLRSFSSMTFNGDSSLFVTHVSGNGAQLAFSGLGIRAFETPGTGIGRQTFFADAGSSGGTILFTHGSGVNVGSGQFARAIDITARGGSSLAASGGHIVFQDSASTSGSTFDALRAEGASVVGASGGEIIVRDAASVTRMTGVVVGGGMSAGALGGRASFQGQAQNAGGVSVQAGQSGGLGGRIEAGGNTVFRGTSSVYAEGGASALAGAEGVMSFRGDAVFMGSAYLGAGNVAGANGGRIDFFDRASHDTTSFPAVSGNLGIYNVGAVQSGANGGALVFHDDAAIRGAYLVIYNQTAEFLAAGASAGSSSFLDRSRAGQVHIENAGGAGAGAAGGSTYFRNQSTAEHAVIVSLGGVFSGAGGGSSQFSDSATAGAATLVNAAGQVLGAAGGVTAFSQTAGAGSAFISNEASLGAGGGSGTAFFKDASSAQNAIIDNHGGSAAINAFTVFSQTATAGNASITNFGGRAAGAEGGFTQFLDQATAGAASLVMAGGGVSGALGGGAAFFVGSTAGNATLDVRGASVVGAAGGAVRFYQSSAGRSVMTVQGSQANGIGGPEGGLVSFAFGATAAQASFTIGGNLFAFGSPGRVQFEDAATAADASFVTLAGFNAGGRLTFNGTPVDTASAGRASIHNGSRLPGAVSTGNDFGGGTLFLAHSSADHAAITNAAGATAFGAQTVFLADSTAGDAVIINAGGRSGDSGGITFFRDSSSAGRARITNVGGAPNASGTTLFDGSASAAQSTLSAAGAAAAGDVGGRLLFTAQSTAAQSTLTAGGASAGGGGGGGRIVFDGMARGGSSRVVLNAGSTLAGGGTLDISGVSSAGAGLTVGSIEGGGNVNLGAKSLIVLGSAGATTFSGAISGSVPALFPALTVLGGALTLTGANGYAGRTQVGDGVNADSGKLVAANTTGSATGSGEVRVERGGTLAGSGFIAGPVTLRAGGTLAPGDPVTLTLQSSLTWDGGGLIRLVLGADDAGSDHLVVHSLVRGTSGPFVFDLIDAGIVAGASYQLLHFDSLVGFVASDFTFAGSGATGRFSIADGVIGFNAAAVPEPHPAALFVLGLLGIAGWSRRTLRTTQAGRCRDTTG